MRLGSELTRSCPKGSPWNRGATALVWRSKRWLLEVVGSAEPTQGIDVARVGRRQAGGKRPKQQRRQPTPIGRIVTAAHSLTTTLAPTLSRYDLHPGTIQAYIGPFTSASIVPLSCILCSH